MNGAYLTETKGFTLIEVLLSVALIAVITGLSLPFYQSFQTRNDLSSTSQGVMEMIRRAQSYSRSNNGDSQWGVNMQAGSATLFKGTTFASRTVESDEVLTIPSSISMSYSGDIVFSKLTGFPLLPLMQTFSSTTDSKSITVNTKGMVNG